LFLSLRFDLGWPKDFGASRRSLSPNLLRGCGKSALFEQFNTCEEIYMGKENQVKVVAPTGVDPVT
jgi:hypothetical protein